MILRQLFEPETSTFTYLVADEASREALLIDPVRELVDRDLKLVEELGLTLRYVLETHVHADHVTGAALLRERTGAKTVGGKQGAPCADLHLGHGDTLRLGALELKVLETPGHTNDSVTYLVGDCLFTGDGLMIRTVGRTDFQSGDAGALYDAIHRHLFTLPNATRVFPGHDYKGYSSSTVGEERQFNARLAGRTREAFIELMGQLNLPPPKKLHVAVPANLQCGNLSTDGRTT